MSSIGDAIGSVVGGITGSGEAAEGAQDAAQIQAASSQAAIDEQKRQFDAITKLLEPFVTAGTGALSQQQALLGLGGKAAQTAAVGALENSPYFRSIAYQGERGILSNAAATGGLRGGNVQGALAQFRPQLLNQLIEQRFSNLGGLTNLGQASAAQQAVAGQQSAANIGNLLGQQGAALAGGEIAKSGANYQAFSDLLKIGGTVASAMGGGF
jgi:hypothetical protein